MLLYNVGLQVFICLTLRWKRTFNKKSARWSVQSVKEKKTYPHLPGIVRNIIQMRIDDNVGMNANVVLEADDPRRIAKNITCVPPPPTLQIALEQKSRSKKEDPDKTIDYWDN